MNPILKISVIIPVKNGASTLKQCLDAIFNQTIIGQTEVIIIDSGSTDDSLEIISKFKIRLYRIPPEEFNHGATRNYGVSIAKGELIYLTVQDAIATDNTLLERMSMHFIEPDVMAVAGRQIVPHDNDKNPHQWFRPYTQPKVEKYFFKSPDEFECLSAIDKRWICSLDDVNAMYRRSALLKLPFRNLQFSEDMVWAADAYRQGSLIIFDQNARVFHYHHQSYNYAYKVSILSTFAEWKYLGVFINYKFRISDLFLIIYRNIKYKAHPKWILNQFCFLYGQQRAKHDFKRILRTNELYVEEYVKSKVLTIPQGKQN